MGEPLCDDLQLAVQLVEPLDYAVPDGLVPEEYPHRLSLALSIAVKRLHELRDRRLDLLD